MKKIIMIISILMLVTGCNKIENFKETNPPSEKLVEVEFKEKNYIVNKDGVTIEERYPEPKGYIRTQVEENSFGEFLRNQKLKAYGGKVIYYNGREKKSNGVYDSVFDVEIGDRDLHQCADAIMLLRGEYP